MFCSVNVCARICNQQKLILRTGINGFHGRLDDADGSVLLTVDRERARYMRLQSFLLLNDCTLKWVWDFERYFIEVILVKFKKVDLPFEVSSIKTHKM